MATLVQELQPTQLKDLDRTLELIRNGEEVELRFASIKALSQDELDLFQQRLIEAGFQLTRPVSVTDDMPAITVVRFIKGPLVPPAPEGGRFKLGVIPLVAASLVSAIPTALIVGLITVGVFKVQTLSQSLLPVIVTGGGLLVLVILARGR